VCKMNMRGGFYIASLFVSLLLLACQFSFGQSNTQTQRHYNVTLDHNITSFVGGNYGSLNSVTMEDDEVFHVSLPFEFQFFERRFKDAYLSSNGLLSFEVAPSQTKAMASSNLEPNLPLSETQFETNIPVKSKLSEASPSLRSQGAASRNKQPQHGEEGASSQESGEEGGKESVSSKETPNSKIIILHRHLEAADLSLLLQDIHERHHSQAPPHQSFSAEVSLSLPHLKMFSTSQLSPAALFYLQKHRHVLHVHANSPLTLDTHMDMLDTGGVAAPSSSSSSSSSSSQYLWGLDRIDQTTLPLDHAAYTPPPRTYAGKGTSVYVVDTGLDTTHVEFQNAASSSREVRNLFNYFGEVSPNQDENGHGTHCGG
jgi:hypothetical protein